MTMRTTTLARREPLHRRHPVSGPVHEHLPSGAVREVPRLGVGVGVDADQSAGADGGLHAGLLGSAEGVPDRALPPLRPLGALDVGVLPISRADVVLESLRSAYARETGAVSTPDAAAGRRRDKRR